MDDLQARLPGLPDLDEATIAVRDFIGASRDLVVRMAQVMGMNATDMSALSILLFQGAMGATELAGRLGISTASASVLVDRMERAGNVERSRDERDRRRVTVSETEAARVASMEAWLPSIMAIDDICRALSAEERAFTVGLLNRLVEAVEQSGRPS